jgi:MFS family permease
MHPVRVAVLLCCCLLTFGSYFSFDLPGALADDFRVVLARNETAAVGLFYSVYSLPNCVLPVVGGILLDQVIGLRRGALLCCSMVALGCTVVALAGSNAAWSGTSTAFTVALAGRFLFGLGGETLSVCQNAFCAKWFHGADMSTAFAIVLSFARVGSAVNFALEPAISSKYGFPAALWLSALLCIVSVCACVALGLLDVRYEAMTKEEPEGGTPDPERGRDAAATPRRDDGDEEDADAVAAAAMTRAERERRQDARARLLDGADEDDYALRREEQRLQRDARRAARAAAGGSRTPGGGRRTPGAVGAPAAARVPVASDAELRRSEASEALDLAVPLLEPAVEAASAAASKSPSALDAFLAVIGTRECLIYLICVLFYVAIFTFMGPVASKLLVATYPGVDKIKAGLLVSIPYTVSAFVSPVLGLTMDRVGRGGFFVMAACLSLCAVHATFAFFPHALEPMVIMVWLGLTYSCCAASLWPMIALVVESRNISTAYGLMNSVQNLGLAIAPMLITPLIPSEPDAAAYRTIEVIFSALAFTAFLSTVALYVVDTRNQGALFLGPLEAGLLATPGGRSPRLNPLNPRATPFLEGRRRGALLQDGLDRPIAPKTPNAIRAQYFRKLRIQSRA